MVLPGPDMNWLSKLVSRPQFSRAGRSYTPLTAPPVAGEKLAPSTDFSWMLTGSLVRHRSPPPIRSGRKPILIATLGTFTYSGEFAVSLPSIREPVVIPACSNSTLAEALILLNKILIEKLPDVGRTW